MRYWTKTYTTAFMLLFMWQLFVLFASPFIAAQELPVSKHTEIKFSAEIDQIEEGTTISENHASNVFVEEILEEEIHPAETLKVQCHSELIFHFAFHKLSDYHASIKPHFLPPEGLI